MSSDLMVRIRADVSGLMNGMRAAEQRVANFDKAVKRSAANRQAINSLGTSFGKVGLAAAGGLALSAKAAVDWETAWAGVTKTTTGSAAQMAKLESELRGLAKTLPTSHAEIAAVAEAAGQLGVKRQDIASFTKTMIDLGQSTNLSADEAATSIAQLANVMGTAPDEIQNLGSALVALGNDGASTERDIIQMAQRIAGAAKVVGASESDVLAISNAVASMGIDVEAGGTAVSRVFATMSEASTSGGAKLKAFAKISGVSAAQFAKSFKDDAAGGLVTFIKGLEKTQKAGGDLYGQLKSVGLNDIRVSQALIGMASSGDLLTDSLKTGSQAWRENTALTNEADKRYKTTASRVKIAINGIRDDMIQIGDEVLPIVADFTEQITKLADAFGNLPGPAKTAIVRTLALTAAIGGGVFVLSRAITGYANFRNNLAQVGQAMGDVNTKQAALRGGALIAGIALLSIADKARESDDSLGDLTETLGYAAAGFAIGGPIGAAVGALAGIISASQKSAETFDSGRGSVKEYAATFDGLSASITSATKAQVFQDLQKTSALRAASALGVANRDLVGYVMGQEGAVKRVNIQLDKYQELLNAGKDVPMAELANGGQVDAVNALRQALGLVAPEFERGRDKALEAARATATWGQALKGLPKGVQVDLKNLNYAPTAKQIDDLRRKYNLTPKQVRTILQAVDQTKSGVDGAKRELDRLPSLKTITIRTIKESYTAKGGTGGNSPGVDAAFGKNKRAAGGPVFGAGTATSDSIPAMLSNGEHVWTAREVALAGGQRAMYAMRDAVRSQGRGFANGGAVGSTASSPGSLALDVSGLKVGFDNDLRPVLRGVIRAEIAGQGRYDSSSRIQDRKPR